MSNEHGARPKDLSARGMKIAIVCSRFNAEACERLLQGAKETLSGLSADKVEVVRVPGAFELPAAARHLSKRYDAVVAIGVVVQGETPHFDFVCDTVSEALQRLATEEGVALGFGLVTTLTMSQALDRAGGKSGNRGSDAAAAAVEMAMFFRHTAGSHS
jgi:6,7-dimethyl-8-ribityllumazine synthase